MTSVIGRLEYSAVTLRGSALRASHLRVTARVLAPFHCSGVTLAARRKSGSLRVHVSGMSVVKRIFLCIGVVIWTLLIHFLAPNGGEGTIFGIFMLAILPLALVAQVEEVWRREW